MQKSYSAFWFGEKIMQSAEKMQNLQLGSAFCVCTKNRISSLWLIIELRSIANWMGILSRQRVMQKSETAKIAGSAF